MMEEGIKAYVVYASTGCSCCSNENHYRGPYTQEEARRMIQIFHDQKLLASQYARNGNYSIEEYDAEILPDGRVIIGNRIFSGFNPIEDYIGHEM